MTIVKIKKFVHHFKAFEIDYEDQSDHKIIILHIDTISGPPINSHKTSFGKTLIRTKQY